MLDLCYCIRFDNYMKQFCSMQYHSEMQCCQRFMLPFRDAKSYTGWITRQVTMKWMSLKLFVRYVLLHTIWRVQKIVMLNAILYDIRCFQRSTLRSERQNHRQWIARVISMEWVSLKYCARSVILHTICQLQSSSISCSVAVKCNISNYQWCHLERQNQRQNEQQDTLPCS